MRNALAGRFILIFALALLVFLAVVQAPAWAESNGSGGTPFPEDEVPPVDSGVTSSTQPAGLSAAELLSLYFLML